MYSDKFLSMLHCLCDVRIDKGNGQHRRRYTKQDAQLSQGDRAAGCVIVLTKSGRLKMGDSILQT